MAEILPIRPWRYNPELAAAIETLTSPIFDVVSDNEIKNLYSNPINSIHLSVPEQPKATDRAASLLSEWKKNEVILQDRLPAIYIYYQYFKLPGEAKEYCRRGFISHIKTYDWEDKVILRDENTIRNLAIDRLELLEKTELHTNPTHGLFTDPTFELEGYMDKAVKNPIYDIYDYQGVRNVLAMIHDAQIIQRFIAAIKDKSIILADGHHCYEGSLMYKQKRKALNPNHSGSEAYNYHLMYLSNTAEPDLRILPTHRIIKRLDNWNEAEIIEKLKPNFTIKPVEGADTLNEIIAGKQSAFGLIFRENAYEILLKPEAYGKLSLPFPEYIKTLDSTVMHYFIIEKALGIPWKDQRQSPHIDSDNSISDCMKKVNQGDAQMAIITNEVSIEDMKKVIYSGFTLPQESVYFYPKVIGGLLFTSIKDEEFEFPLFSPF
jgi:uncharacterized protein (DUF1015 family)